MPSLQWFTELTQRERRTLYAGFGGYAVDAFDFMIYSFLIPTLIATWGMTKSEAGMIATSSLISSAIGGWLAGILADRYGRIRVLQWTIATFAIFTCLSGFTNSFWQLLTTRTLQGIGFGGEWSVVTIMMAETIRSPQHRAKAVGTVQSSWSFGWAAAAIVYWASFALLPEQYAWRACFWIGLLPAAWIIYIRRNVSDPEIYLETRRARESGFDTSHFLQIFSFASPQNHPARQRAVHRHARRLLRDHHLAADLSEDRAPSVGVQHQRLSDRADRRLVHRLYRRRDSVRHGSAGARRSCCSRSARSYSAWSTRCCRSPTCMMLALGFPLGIVVQGIFAGVGAYLSELYPNEIRGSGQGFCYNLGRGLGSFFPILVGTLSQTMTLVKAMGIVAGSGYLLVIVAALCLPETKGKVLGTTRPGRLNSQYTHMKTIVLGGGVIGVATAFYLCQQGCEVTVIEREPDVALSTSFGNAGVIAPGYVTPWAAPGMPAKILKYLFKPASPLIFRPTFDPAQWRWIARWLRECDLERFRVNKQRMQRIAYYSRDCLHEFRGRHPFDYGRSQGYLQLFRSEYDVELAQPALDGAARRRASRIAKSARRNVSRSNRVCAGRVRRHSPASIFPTTKPAIARASPVSCARSASATVCAFASTRASRRSMCKAVRCAACVSKANAAAKHCRPMRWWWHWVSIARRCSHRSA